MVTKINGLQATKVDIKKECRELHGEEGALKEAFKIIKERYSHCLQADCNKNTTFSLYLILDRD